MGLIAQEVEGVYRDIVHTDENGFKSVQYASLIAPIIESVKALNSHILTIQEQYSTNEATLASLAQRVTTLEQRR